MNDLSLTSYLDLVWGNSECKPGKIRLGFKVSLLQHRIGWILHWVDYFSPVRETNVEYIYVYIKQSVLEKTENLSGKKGKNVKGVNRRAKQERRDKKP